MLFSYLGKEETLDNMPGETAATPLVPFLKLKEIAHEVRAVDR